MPDHRTWITQGPALVLYAALFFLSIDLVGGGMKASFKHVLKEYLHEHAASFSELSSFVIGVLGTSLVQSSSTVSSMAVVLTGEGIVPLIIAVGIVHGANLGTSVTSSIVAFFSDSPALTGNLPRDVHSLFFRRRGQGFHRAVSTAVVHGLFNLVMVTAILLSLELPFGLVHTAAASTAGAIDAALLAQGGSITTVLQWVSPKTYTGPIVSGLLGVGVPGWVAAMLGLLLLFACLKGFSSAMTGLLMKEDGGGRGTNVDALGDRLLGGSALDTFFRGLLLTCLVQSSSATTSMVVPLAAMGLFSLRKIFPFILGANIGTTLTALIAAGSAVGSDAFLPGLTIALSHTYLNTLAVVLVVAFPGLRTSVLTLTDWLADAAVKMPAVLVGYLLALVVGMPGLVYLAPEGVATVVLAVAVLAMILAPHVVKRRAIPRTAETSW